MHISTVCPITYAHCFVVLCFDVVILRVPKYLGDLSTNIIILYLQFAQQYINGLVQNCSIFIDNALEGDTAILH